MHYAISSTLTATSGMSEGAFTISWLHTTCSHNDYGTRAPAESKGTYGFSDDGNRI